MVEFLRGHIFTSLGRIPTSYKYKNFALIILFS